MLLKMEQSMSVPYDQFAPLPISFMCKTSIHTDNLDAYDIEKREQEILLEIQAKQQEKIMVMDRNLYETVYESIFNDYDKNNQSLSLRNKRLTDQQVHMILHYFNHNEKNIINLDLSGNRLTDIGAFYVFDFIRVQHNKQNVSMKTLNLHENSLTKLGRGLFDDFPIRCQFKSDVETKPHKKQKTPVKMDRFIKLRMIRP
jgi:hypothetical protein